MDFLSSPVLTAYFGSLDSNSFEAELAIGGEEGMGGISADFLVKLGK